MAPGGIPRRAKMPIPNPGGKLSGSGGGMTAVGPGLGVTAGLGVAVAPIGKLACGGAVPMSDAGERGGIGVGSPQAASGETSNAITNMPAMQGMSRAPRSRAPGSTVLGSEFSGAGARPGRILDRKFIR
jgi:hypothetical protein